MHVVRRAALVITAGIAALLLTGASKTEPSFVPVFKQNFPDAFVLVGNFEFIAYSTNDGANVPVAVSSDLVHWNFAQDPSRPGKQLDALPKLGRWAKEGFTWAPEVLKLRNSYLLYYTASDRKKNAQCIGVALASSPFGPFIDDREEPIVCQTELGGSIDPNVLQDADGKLYLYFKNDGNRVHAPTSLWGQRLGSEGLSVSGRPVELVKDDQGWEERVVEAPTMVRSPAGYELFFSGGFFGWIPEEGGLSPYAMGYARCASPLGPCAPARENPILHSFNEAHAGCLSGPGHQSIFTLGTRSFISFHAWEAGSGCRKKDERRYLYVAPLFWTDGKPRIGPSLR